MIQTNPSCLQESIYRFKHFKSVKAKFYRKNAFISRGESRKKWIVSED